jgi:benzoylsuccinyl-CoA thiolase BbsB subunit
MRYRDRELADYGSEAVRNALSDAGLALNDIGVAICGAREVGLGPGARVLKMLGATTMPVVNVEAASATGGVAFREAGLHIAAGLADVALAFGVGKNGAPIGHLGGSDPQARLRERAMGLLPAAGEWAMKFQRRQLDTGTAEDACVRIAVKAHRNGSHNPYAHRNRLVTPEEVRSSRMVCEPLTVYHCCPASDGAAAAILTSESYAKKHCSQPLITFEASEFQTHVIPRDDGLSKSAVVTAKAYDAAGLGPEDIDFVEGYDSFSLEELLQYEDLGFARPGEAEQLILEGATEIGGRIPFGTDGGNLSRGHAIGPTGLAQLWEAVQQLRGTAGPRQVTGARIGMIHQLGASGEALTHILQRN